MSGTNVVLAFSYISVGLFMRLEAWPMLALIMDNLPKYFCGYGSIKAI